MEEFFNRYLLRVKEQCGHVVEGAVGTKERASRVLQFLVLRQCSRHVRLAVSQGNEGSKRCCWRDERDENSFCNSATCDKRHSRQWLVGKRNTNTQLYNVNEKELLVPKRSTQRAKFLYQTPGSQEVRFTDTLQSVAVARIRVQSHPYSRKQPIPVVQDKLVHVLNNEVD